MMNALHKVNTMKRETIAFIKSKHPFIHKLGYHTQGYIMGYMSFVQSGQDGTRPSKTKWAREPCSHAAGHIRGYKLSSYLLA
jgi:hypothetical protein